MIRSIVCISLLATIFNSIGQKSYKIDFKDPKSVVNAIFYAAENKDFEILGSLCDPNGKGDIDTKSICGLSESTETGVVGDKTTRTNLITSLKKGKLVGIVTYGSYEGTKTARVPFLFGPNGKTEETMNLIQRNGNWYLSSF